MRDHSCEQVRGIRVVEAFFQVDTDGSGQLDKWEFDDAIQRMGLEISRATCGPL